MKYEKQEKKSRDLEESSRVNPNTFPSSLEKLWYISLPNSTLILDDLLQIPIWYFVRFTRRNIYLSFNHVFRKMIKFPFNLFPIWTLIGTLLPFPKQNKKIETVFFTLESMFLLHEFSTFRYLIYVYICLLVTFQVPELTI